MDIGAILQRRDLVGGIGALALSLATGGCERLLEALAARPTRRNISNLAPNDPILQTYRDAIGQMKALPSSDARNWTRQAQIHFNKCSHGNWWLLPWHRWYLVRFEAICRKLTGNVDFALPYWNWADNPAVPDVFYASGDILNDTTKALPQGIPISAEFVAHSVLEGILSEPNFQIFGSGAAPGQQDVGPLGSGPLEAMPHNHVHTSIGGDMGTFMSPLDPIFWTHHSMLDYCWVDWDLVRNNRSPSDPAWVNLNFTDFADENGAPVASVAGFSVLLPIIFYQYEPSQIGASVARMPFMRNRAEQDQLKAVVQRGASAEIALRARFRVPRAIRVELGRVAAAPIAIDETVVRQAMQASATSDRVLLVLGQVEQPAAADFFVRVFINAPGAISAATPITDPHYAGSFAFFLDSGAHAGMPMGPAGFTVDVTDTVRRVGTGGQLNVQLVAVPYPGRTVTARSFGVGALELAVARFGEQQPR